MNKDRILLLIFKITRINAQYVFERCCSKKNSFLLQVFACTIIDLVGNVDNRSQQAIF